MTGIEPETRLEQGRRRPPSLRQWLSPEVPGGRLLGWLGPLIVTLFAGVLRFWNLGRPRAVIFDETYYAKDAYALLKFGYEHNTVKDADKLLLQHPPNLDIWANGGSFIAHPPAGKWMIAVGEWLFGMTPFGWRFSAALFGTLSVLILARVARRMTRSNLLGTAAGLLLAVDGMHLVTSRTAILDIFVMFWILAAFACLVIDRDVSRATLARKIAERGDDDGLGPFVMHWWLIPAGLCLGTATATKWTGLYYIAAFGVLTLVWSMGSRRAAGVRSPYAGVFAFEAIPAFLSVVVLSAITYVAWWSGWIFNAGGWGRGRVASGPVNAFFQAMPRLWDYHQQMWHFHTTLTVKHDYQSWPWNWLVLKRPVAFYYTQPSGCGASTCSREVLDIGTPAIWWVSIVTLLVLAAWWLVYRDWRAGATLLGFLAGWVPWFYYGLNHRTMFLFYATPMLPFMVLSIVLTIGLIIGPATAPPGRRVFGAAVAGAYVLTVLANFYYLYPVLAGQILPYSSWHARMWFMSWI
ncbi:phospholipid carrier-dependent glycosyltransferase [Actinoallomurus purpureus]|uniref:dolichyl-phosphate-mannose--protein mannosyltransferase n=1 Tax=Actinoallomurus purpureus TaxID=478114 RepID=UPI0020924E5D|nr:phospholipid carrier-dependent glycosyltransferase [Actinoallomurus purpureus]MCO6006793.1 phospholipid carrier-dependent glycosyltransferase [Actinoallomurus purpureus]